MLLLLSVLRGLDPGSPPLPAVLDRGEVARVGEAVPLMLPARGGGGVGRRDGLGARRDRVGDVPRPVLCVLGRSPRYRLGISVATTAKSESRSSLIRSLPAVTDAAHSFKWIVSVRTGRNELRLQHIAAPIPLESRRFPT